MRNIIFTAYFSNLEDFLDLPDYNAVMEPLMIIHVQDKLNREKKMRKVMYCLSKNLESDYIENFIKNYYNKKVWEGLVNLDVSAKHIDWNSLTDQEKKDFLIEKWKVLFSNLSDDYFVVDKSEVIQSLEELRKSEWRISYPLFKKKLKYNKDIYDIILEVSPQKAELLLIRDSDEKRFNLKNYQARKILFDINFKNFKIINDDTLMLENKTIFLAPEVFNLASIIN